VSLPYSPSLAYWYIHILAGRGPQIAQHILCIAGRIYSVTNCAGPSSATLQIVNYFSGCNKKEWALDTDFGKLTAIYFVEWNGLKKHSLFGRAVAKAVSRWLPTAEARVRVRAACGVCGGQSGTGAGFLRVLRFPLPIIILPISPS
jgi:hypothetical protein